MLSYSFFLFVVVCVLVFVFAVVSTSTTTTKNKQQTINNKQKQGKGAVCGHVWCYPRLALATVAKAQSAATCSATLPQAATTTTIISPTGHPVFPRQGDHLGEGFFPHFVGGIHGPKSPLFSPYPAIPPNVVRTPHPGMTDDREHITEQGTLANVCNCFGSNDDTLKVLNMKKSLSTFIKFLKA